MKQNVVAFYQFVPLEDLPALRVALEARALALEIRGTILLATEGINGTLTGTHEKLQQFIDWLREKAAFADLECKYSSADSGNRVFHRLKVRIKPEIVSLGQPGLSPGTVTGEHVGAAEWNALIADPDVLVIDTRNSYEIAIGTFPGAQDPQTRSFRQFPEYVSNNLQAHRDKPVAMFCTGGIRCEKASAYLLDQGFSKVFQLDGGILKYLETVDPEENCWRGECFVFDQRVSVDEQLVEGSFAQCFACRRALSEADLESSDYQAGISCPHCKDERNEQQLQGFRERQKQIELAAARGEQHIGRVMGASDSETQ